MDNEKEDFSTYDEVTFYVIVQLTQYCSTAQNAVKILESTGAFNFKTKGEKETLDILNDRLKKIEELNNLLKKWRGLL